MSTNLFPVGSKVRFREGITNDSASWGAQILSPDGVATVIQTNNDNCTISIREYQQTVLTSELELVKETNKKEATTMDKVYKIVGVNAEGKLVSSWQGFAGSHTAIEYPVGGDVLVKAPEGSKGIYCRATLDDAIKVIADGRGCHKDAKDFLVLECYPVGKIAPEESPYHIPGLRCSALVVNRIVYSKNNGRTGKKWLPIDIYPVTRNSKAASGGNVIALYEQGCGLDHEIGYVANNGVKITAKGYKVTTPKGAKVAFTILKEVESFE